MTEYYEYSAWSASTMQQYSSLTNELQLIPSVPHPFPTFQQSPQLRPSAI